jgi:hypothetical protein
LKYKKIIKKMIVEIPRIKEHAGYYGHLVTVEISDTCPKCGGERGVERWKGFSYDGSRRLVVDCCKNSCEHIDLYCDVMNEAIKSKVT